MTWFDLSAQSAILHSTLERRRAQAEITSHDHKVTSGVPESLDTIKKVLNLKPNLTIYTTRPRAHENVENTLDLARPAFWTTPRQASEVHTKNYCHYFYRSLTGLKTLLLHIELVPNHHVGLHINEMLLQFGPMHGLWGFPFERIVGDQRLNSKCIGGASYHSDIFQTTVNVYLQAG